MLIIGFLLGFNTRGLLTAKIPVSQATEPNKPTLEIHHIAIVDPNFSICDDNSLFTLCQAAAENLNAKDRKIDELKADRQTMISRYEELGSLFDTLVTEINNQDLAAELIEQKNKIAEGEK